MKKILMVLAIAGFAVACNNGSEKKDEKKDTTIVAPIDTTTHPAPMDTTQHADTTKM